MADQGTAYDDLQATPAALPSGGVTVGNGELSDQIGCDEARYLAELTPLHLRVLTYIDKREPERFLWEDFGKLQSDFCRDTQMNMSASMFRLCCDDLVVRQLAGFSGMLVNGQLNAIPGKHNFCPEGEMNRVNSNAGLTDLGCSFLAYISAPDSTDATL